MLFLKNEAKLIPLFVAIALIVANIIDGQKTGASRRKWTCG
jgi:hypothetical protein